MNRPVTFLKRFFETAISKFKPKPQSFDPQPAKRGLPAISVQSLPKKKRIRKIHLTTGGYSGNAHQRRIQRRMEARVSKRMAASA